MGITFSSLVPVIATDIGIQGAAFAISAPLKTEKLYDISGSMTYAACIAVSLFARKPMPLTFNLRQKLVSTCVLLWTTRLGIYLGYRVISHGKDSRFDKLKTDPLKFSVVWGMQALWVFLTAFPCFVINQLPLAKHAPFGWLDGIGLALWVVGFSMEAIADLQKLRWQEQLGEKRHTEFINHGLWSLSRHPNYFGEVVLWVGNYLMCVSAFRNAGSLGIKAAGLFLISPIFVTGLICGISGIPLLEAASEKKFGHLPAYLEYKEKTPVFFPKFTNLNEKEINKQD